MAPLLLHRKIKEAAHPKAAKQGDLAAEVAAAARRRAQSGRVATAGGSRLGAGDADKENAGFLSLSMRNWGKPGLGGHGNPGGFSSADDFQAAIKARQATLRPVNREGRKLRDTTDRGQQGDGRKAPWQGLLRKGVERLRQLHVEEMEPAETPSEWE